MIPTWTFRQLLGLPTEDWTEQKLNHVSASELTDLCCLVGIPYSGTKQEKISRLLTQTEVQRRGARVRSEARRTADSSSDTSLC